MRKQTLVIAFKNAFNGLYHFFYKEKNGGIQVGIAVGILILSFVLGLSYIEWIVVLLCIGGVLSLEMLNSAIEKLCDLVQKEYHPAIKVIKDVSAAAVLSASIISALIGTIIFLPKILSLL